MIAANPYRLGNRKPARVEEPGDATHVAALLNDARENGDAVVTFGGATLQSIGNAPGRYTVALATRRLDRVAAYDPRDLTIGVEAGATLAHVAHTLAQARQFIPFDAPLPGRATVGGTLAAGWAGPRRAAYGATRDLLIGTTVALSDGSLATAGGMVVKNVTGYDMSKLYVGSLGTLGVIVRANFKALPLPAAQRMAVAPLNDDVRDRAIAALATMSIEPAVALVIDGFACLRIRDEAARLIVLFEGSAAVIERATRELRWTLGKCGVAETVLLDGNAAAHALQLAIDAYIEPVADRSITYRHPGLPVDVWQRAGALAQSVRERGARCDVIADLRTGDAIVRIAGTTADAIDDALPDLDATVRAALPAATVLAGDPHVRARVDAWGAPPATLPTQRAIKARFDPSGTLAPGRYVGGL